MRGKLGIAVGIVLSVCGALQAGNLTLDTNGMAPWQGAQTFDTAHTYGPGATYFTATIDYCVYQPGNFTKSFPTASVDQSDYVYAYQIVDVETGTQGFGGYVTRFSLGITPPGGGDALPVEIGFLPGSDANLVDPSSSLFGVSLSGIISTAGWNFSTQVDANEQSPVLYFASPFAPQRANASVTGTLSKGDTELSSLPSPTPEPATLALLGLGISVLLRRSGRRTA